MLLQNRVALVTGAAGGLGQEICAALVKDGARLILTDVERAGEALASLRQELVQHGEAAVLTGDITDEGFVDRLVQFGEGSFGMIHLLVNCAGANENKYILNLSPASFKQQLMVNLYAPFVTTQAVGLLWKKKKKAGLFVPEHCRIVNIASVNGTARVQCGQAGYTSSKTGLVSFTEVTACEFADFFGPVTVNAISPGYLDRGMSKEMKEDELAQRVAATPFKRLVRAEHIAGLIVQLAGDERFANMTGQNLVVDAGLCLRN